MPGLTGTCRAARLAAVAAVVGLAGGGLAGEVLPVRAGVAWRLPPGLPPPPVPAGAEATAELVELGRHLFFDRRLSGNGRQSCGDCHRPELGFADGRSTALGSTGEPHFRNTPGLTNVGYEPALGWAEPGLRSLERQALRPLFGVAPVEMGAAGRLPEILARLNAEPRYGPLVRAAFPDDGDDPLDLPRILRALAAFERSLVAFDSPFDRFAFRGDGAAMSLPARRGMELYFSPRTRCSDCHGRLQPSADPAAAGLRSRFTQTALYDVDGSGAYPPHDPGVRRVTGDVDDDGLFKAPRLRNVAVTAPYMHDGSVATLEEVVRLYAAGGRSPESPRKDARLAGFELAPGEVDDLVAFLESLTDRNFLSDPLYENPW